MGRRQGKQPGAPGYTLSQVTDPDSVVVHQPAQCRGCDRPLAEAEVIGVTTRQVFDVPDPKVVVVEHQAERRRCECGCSTTATFPAEVTAPACYGPSIKAHAIYLLMRSASPPRAVRADPDRFVRCHGVDRDPGQLDPRSGRSSRHVHGGGGCPTAGRFGCAR